MIAIWRSIARRRLPLGHHAAMPLLPWIFVLMAYVAGLGGVGLLATRDGLRAADASIAGRMTLTVAADASDARLQTVLALLRQTAGVAAVQVLTPAETAALLQPWLGPAAPLDLLPVPRVIDVRINRGATVDLTTLRQHLASVEPEAKLDDHQAPLDGPRRAVRRIDRVLVAVIIAALLLVVPAALFATRTALMVDRSTVELLHLLGAGDGDIAGHFAFRALAPALLGGAIGGIAVLLTVAALGDIGGMLDLPATGVASGLADWRIWAIAIGVALAAAAIAIASAQAMVLRRLAGMP